MATAALTREHVRSEEFAPVRDFLERFGIPPSQFDHYDQFVEDNVLKAIRAKGWEPTIEDEMDPPGWMAMIREWRTGTQFRSAVAHDRDRVMALVRALRVALTWPTPEEDFRSFDEQTRALIGLSANEFFERWRNNELSTDDPRVVHLLIARPLG